MRKIICITLTVLIFLSPASILAEEAKSKGHHHYKGKMFEKMDTNTDGVISEEEFLANSKKRFTKMDADGDGKLTKEEVKAFFSEMKEKYKEKREKYKNNEQE